MGGRLLTMLVITIATTGVSCGTPASPSPGTADFVIAVEGEQFILRTTDPQTIQAAKENWQGRNQQFPIGPLRAGNGGFNAPWSWHLDPAATRFVDAAIEVCDGRPSYVETHQSEFSTYCPWGAKVIGRR